MRIRGEGLFWNEDWEFSLDLDTLNLEESEYQFERIQPVA